MHTVTAKLNQSAREFANDKGITFFVSLGEKNYDYKTKQNVWTNYDAALFAKDAQIQFYRDMLIENAIVSVSGTGLIVDASDPQYKPKLMIQDAKLGFVSNGSSPQQGQQQGQQQNNNQGGFNQQNQHQQNNFQQQSNDAQQSNGYKDNGGFMPQQQNNNQGGFNQNNNQG